MLNIPTDTSKSKSNITKSKSKSSYEDEQDRKLAENIKKLKARKEVDAKQRIHDAKDKKNKLLELRAEKKSELKANNQLKNSRTSSKLNPNKVRKDVISTGRNQCDNDDYGFESNASDSIYDKLMKKYEANPEDPMAKFARPKSMEYRSKPDKNAVPDPKFQPFRRKEPEKVSPSSKKENHSQSHSNSSSTSEKKPSVKKNINKSAPPPPSFAELMKMAKQAKSKPIPKVSSKISSNGKELEPDRPMTQKQREEYMREKNSQLRKNGKLPSTYNNASSSENSSNSKTKSGSGSGTSSSKPETHITSAASTSTANSNKLSPVGPCKENNFKQPCQKKNKPVIENFGPQFHPAVVNKSKSNKQSGNGSNNKRPRSRSPSPIGRSSSSSKSSSSSYSKSKNSSNKYRIESDEEYDDDSDMDDFIDDSEANPSQISAMIGQMFGYDRRKFRNEDDFDDRSMENNKFSSIMKEEAYSARIGRQEDLEDMRREEEEEKRKRAMKKKKKY